mgnify:FL=1
MNRKIILLPVLSLLLGGCALLDNPYYYSYRRCATPFSRPCISVRPGCRPSTSRCATFGRSSSYGNAWNRALNTLQREAHEERSFISNVARTGMKWYENAARAEMNAYKSAAKWMGLW